MVSGPDNQLINEAENLLAGSAGDEVDYLSTKWTYAEYEAKMNEEIDYPNPDDTEDPRYYMKYAHTVPPPEAYYIIPERKDCVAIDDKSKNDRRIYAGWNNMTTYEKEGIAALKQFIREGG